MLMERFEAPEGKTFRFRRRPTCHSVEWSKMIEWCAVNVPNDSVANSTWFCFTHEADARRFEDECSSLCVDINSAPLGQVTLWDVMGL